MGDSMELIYEFSRLVQQNTNSDDILNKAVEIAGRLTDAQNILLALYDSITNELYCNFCSDMKSTPSNTFFRFDLGKGIIGWVAANREIVRIKNAYDDFRYDSSIDKHCSKSITTVLSVPMLIHGKLIGVIQVMNKKSYVPFSVNDEYYLNIFATQLAAAIENIRLTEENLNKSLLSHIGENIANSAHGIKNILNNIDGGTFIVERGVLSHKMEMVDKGWDIMKRNSYRLRELVLDMLLFSRPTKPEYIPSDINKICRDVYELIAERAKEEHTGILLDLDNSIGEVCIDPKGIYRSILNLVSNAIYACKEIKNGIIKIKTEVIDRDWFKIEISDNGSGISKENLGHIFDVFFTTKGSKGTGLGLSVTRKIVLEHHGDIKVSSKLKKGTVFTITLPGRI